MYSTHTNAWISAITKACSTIEQYWAEGYEVGAADTPGNLEKLNPYSEGEGQKWWLRGFWAGWHSHSMVRGNLKVPPAALRK
jgi:hypothetical protein